MRALIIGPAQKDAIRKVVAYALDPKHFYHVGDPVPGGNPDFVALIPDGFRCVFTITKHGGKLFRQLSVSVPDQGRRPSPEAMIMLATEFGFTVSTDDLNLTTRMERDRWLVSTGHEGENSIVAIQPLEEPEPHA